MSKKAFFACLALAASISAAPVLTWVAPYAIYADKTKLQNNAIANQLTHLGLQLWNPVTGGGLSYAPLNANGDLPTDADIQWYVNWAHGKGIKVWLTVYNNSETNPSWNWSLVSGIVTNTTARTQFVSKLVAEVNKFGLDGVDLDLEGNVTETASEKTGYLNLVKELKAALPAGKEINVDSFHYQWNAPNWNWWSALINNGADYVTSMGYQDLGANPPSCDGGGTWCSYASQTTQMGTNKNKLILGVPGHLDSWQGGSIAQNLQGISAQNGPGVGIWEVYNMTSSWLAGPSQLSTIKGSTSYSSSATLSSSAALSSTTTSSAAQSSSGTALSSSATSTGNCTTWASNLYTYNGTWSGPAKVTTNGTTAWSCVAGQEAYCNSYSPTQNDWNQWQAAGNCTGTQSSSAALSSSVKLSSVAIVSSSSNTNTPVNLLTPLALMNSQGTSLQIQGEGLVQLQLRDLQGHVVWQDQKLIAGNSKVEMNRQAQGHYILEMRLGNQVQHVQMVLR